MQPLAPEASTLTIRPAAQYETGRRSVVFSHGLFAMLAEASTLTIRPSAQCDVVWRSVVFSHNVFARLQDLIGYVNFWWRSVRFSQDFCQALIGVVRSRGSIRVVGNFRLIQVADLPLTV